MQCSGAASAHHCAMEAVHTVTVGSMVQYYSYTTSIDVLRGKIQSMFDAQIELLLPYQLTIWALGLFLLVVGLGNQLLNHEK